MNVKSKVQFLRLAQDIATEVGRTLQKRNPTSMRVHVSEIHDVKIEADLKAERKIIQYLSKNSQLPILSEESGEMRSASYSQADSELRWIVDPLDGSLNYIKGIPMSGVSIGLWDAEIPILGVVYDIFRDDLYSGVVGDASWRNRKKINVSNIHLKSDSVLCTGMPVKNDFATKALHTFVSEFQEYKKVRLLGSASLSLCMIASGAAEIYKENNIQIWDVGGGLPIVLGAGGAATFHKTSVSRYTYDVYVTNGSQ
ncbi:inositol monophosphatase family protein [Leptospira borgpetersenii]|uniref:Inositol monophosphatase family protein n=2 Tax=Leptospira borgpetersenii serovar Hardjo-bovis TaxID=338217 RepID=Q04TL3_LEPBJ|nr:inositol monophosphatase [Leptospira borgpetersenii]ABJ75757.1 Inositol monophosphatase family protein [Leptospira borgpetersenii serovar Hardjo-bovis str. JB197]ABJ78701.1 Inositol monophosphatase family protein [Leptospira borgpetersenii serovar Hardjo-bovis str. L550]AMX57990.1 inositol phosphatase [Leptospira borgpetersenii serovar Hardjo]AMX61221.1 inositol phosphatase [Leptospira borgpetersenii serovar Hardjo]AMX64465.1 inositol phosphatase [Leptospira borgpetersenii serovar Hardjo]